MPRLINRLTAAFVAQVTEPGRYPDGNNLYLQVGGATAKSWIYEFAMRGVTREMGLGSVRDFTLAEARERCRKARQLVADGIDPIEAKRQRQAQERAQAAARITLKEECGEFIAAFAGTWRSPKSKPQWETTFEQYVYPIAGDLSVGVVDVPVAVKILQPIWGAKTETAHRIRQRLERVVARSIARGHRSGPNPFAWKGCLDNVLPARRRVSPIEHHASMPFDQVPAFMAALRKRSDLSARALELLILTWTRTGEVIGARLPEFDLQSATWTIPGARTKSGRDFVVALSAPAVRLVEGLDAHGPDKLLFPGRGDEPASNGMLLALLRRMKRSDATPHGFRASARTWGQERSSFASEILEAALGHAISDQTVAAYARGSFEKKRRALAEAWAAFLDAPARGQIVAIAAVRK